MVANAKGPAWYRLRNTHWQPAMHQPTIHCRQKLVGPLGRMNWWYLGVPVLVTGGGLALVDRHWRLMGPLLASTIECHPSKTAGPARQRHARLVRARAGFRTHNKYPHNKSHANSNTNPDKHLDEHSNTNPNKHPSTNSDAISRIKTMNIQT